MEPDKNLHAKIPPALLAEAEKAASADHISVDELVRDAMERRLRAGPQAGRWGRGRRPNHSRVPSRGA
jgi:hypothetical protein